MKRSIVVLFAFFFGVLGVSAAVALDDGPPPLPPWRNADGTLDPAQTPDMIPVAGPDGEVVGYASSAELFGPPPPLVNGASGNMVPGQEQPNGNMVPGQEQPIRVVTESGTLVGHIESGTFVRAQ